MLRKVLIKNYRAFRDWTLEFSRGVNIIVGSNDAGKSTLLEAINLALTARLPHGYPISAEISPHLFNQETTAQYVRDLRSGGKPEPPEIVDKGVLDDVPQYAGLVGSNSLLGVDGPGVRLKIVLDEDFSDGYQAYIANPNNVSLVPTEYYTWLWLDFGGNPVKNARYLPDASLVDASGIRLQNGTGFLHAADHPTGIWSGRTRDFCPLLPQPARDVRRHRRDRRYQHQARGQPRCSQRPAALPLDRRVATGRLGTHPGPAS